MDTNTALVGNVKLPSSVEEIRSLVEFGKKDTKYCVEDFFRKPKKTAFKISPDGTYYSFLAPFERRQNIYVQKIGEEQQIQITFEKDRDISGYFWKGNDRLLFVKDNGGDENYALYAAQINGDKPIKLTPFEKVKIEILDALPEEENHLIISMNKNNPMLFEPYRINIKNGSIEQLAENTNPEDPISSWMTDHEGKLRIASKVTNGTNNTLMYRKTEQDPFEEVITTDYKESISPLFFDFGKEHQVYVSSNLGRDKSVLVKYDMLAKKEVGPIIFEHPDVDVSSMSYSRKRKVPTAVSYFTSKRGFHFLDKKTGAMQDRLQKAFPDLEVVLSSTTKNEDKFIVRTYSDRSLGAYYLYDTILDTLEKITDVSPWIDKNEMAKMKPIQYQSRDGMTINAYLSLPFDHKRGDKIPLIVNPHGGPWARDYWGFNPEIQLFASRGFGVLQMNFRGSVGYGRKFWESSFKQWGQAMQNDITDGVDYLIKEGIADPDKVGIYGASYGGFATLAGVTFTPDLYKAAVDYVGVSNLFTFMKTIPPYWKPYLEMMYEMVGHPEKDKEMMEAASPAYHIDKIKTPLFVVQGANDPRVNIDESDQIVEALRKKNVEVPYLVKYNEGHGFRNEENQFEFYKAMLGFFEKHLG